MSLDTCSADEVGFVQSLPAIVGTRSRRHCHRLFACHHHQIHRAGSSQDGEQCSPNKEAAARPAVAKLLDLVGAGRRVLELILTVRDDLATSQVPERTTNGSDSIVQPKAVACFNRACLAARLFP